MKHVNANVKIVVSAKKIIIGILAHVLLRIASIADTSVIEDDEIISVMNLVSTKKKNIIPTDGAKNCHRKKVRYKFDCYILHTVLLVIILLLIINIICYHCAKRRSKLKIILPRQQYKLKNDEFKKIHIKNRTCYYFDDIIKLEDIDFDNISIDEKSHENILIYDISYENLIGRRPLRIRFHRIDGFIRIYDGT